jgi:hypothetical protein
MVFDPSDPDYLFLVGEKEVRLVALQENVTIKKFPIGGTSIACETDAVAVHPTGQFLFVATNFTRRLICFATQGTRLLWNVSTDNEEPQGDEDDAQAVQSLALITLADQEQTLFFAGMSYSLLRWCIDHFLHQVIEFP